MFRNKLLYLLFLLAAALFAVLYNDYFTGILFLAAAVLPLVLFILLLLTYLGIRVDLKADVPVIEKGENLSLTVTFTNNSALPIPKLRLWLFYMNELSGIPNKEKISLSLDQKNSKTITYHMISDYCGILRFRIPNIRLYDYFLLCSLKKKIRKELTVTVIPRLTLIPADLIQENNRAVNFGEQYSPVKGGDDPSEVFAIREYREGDKPRGIHWKLSYKQDQLMMKEYSEPVSHSVILILDLPEPEEQKDRPALLDGLLECAMSLSYSCCLKEHSHTLVWYEAEQGGISRIFIREVTELYAVMERILKGGLAHLRQPILEEYRERFPKEAYTHMIYVTSVLTKESLYEWVDTCRFSLHYLFYVNDILNFPLNNEMKQLLEKLEVSYYEIDLKNIRNEILSIQVS